MALRHRDFIGEQVHTPYFHVYADEAAREAATGFVSGDVNKTALQLSDATEWVLADDSPITWIPLNKVPIGGTTGQVLKKASDDDYDLIWDDESGGGGSGPNFFGLHDLVLPPDTGWSWDNQSSSTVDSTEGWEYLYMPMQSGVKLSGRYRTPANSHFRVRVALLHDMSGALKGTNVGGDAGYVVGFRDSSGKLVVLLFQVEGGNWKITSTKWNSSTSYAAGYKATGTATVIRDIFNNPEWVQIDYDGTNIIFYNSIDGRHFEVYDTRALTDFLGAGTPDVFFGGYVNSSDVAVALISYEETALA